MDILCLTQHDLDGPDYGGTIRGRSVFRLLEHFGKVRVLRASVEGLWSSNSESRFGGFELAGTVHFKPAPIKSLRDRLRHELDPRFMNTHGVEASAEDRRRLDDLLRQHDLVWVFDLQVADGFGLWRWPNAVLDVDNVASSLYRTMLASATGLVDRLRWRRQILIWRRRERAIRERFDAVCVCSEPDRRILGEHSGLFVLPNGYECPEPATARQLATPPRIGFVGTFRYRPNRDGVRWFVAHVWPRILRAFPSARLRLAGDGSDREPWEQPNVDALGWHESIESEMATWAVSIVPIFVGGGTRIKIAESFGRRCPVVSTTVGAYGYDVRDGHELLIADAPLEFAAKCMAIVNSRELADRLSDKAWRLSKGWTWDAQLPVLKRIVARAARQ